MGSDDEPGIDFEIMVLDDEIARLQDLRDETVAQIKTYKRQRRILVDKRQREAVKTRCKAMTYAGRPHHLLVRCDFEEGHKGSHHSTMQKGDEND